MLETGKHWNASSPRLFSLQKHNYSLTSPKLLSLQLLLFCFLLEDAPGTVGGLGADPLCLRQLINYGNVECLCDWILGLKVCDDSYTRSIWVLTVWCFLFLFCAFAGNNVATAIMVSESKSNYCNCWFITWQTTCACFNIKNFLNFTSRVRTQFCVVICLKVSGVDCLCLCLRCLIICVKKGTTCPGLGMKLI